MKKQIYTIVCLCLSLTMLSCNGNKQKENGLAAEQNAKNATEVVDMHNAENSLDYWGTYVGTFPAADCPGIDMTLVINKDKSYTWDYKYLERDATFQEKGTYTVEGNIMTLTDKDGQVSYFKVEEGQIRKLDNEKKQITGDLADMFILKMKQTAAE